LNWQERLARKVCCIKLAKAELDSGSGCNVPINYGFQDDCRLGHGKGNVMRFRFAVLVFLAISASPVFAADIQAGMWALSLENRVQAAPDFMPQSYTLNQCLTDQDARDPSRVLGGMANPGASDCTYTDKSYSGNTFHFRMQCAGSLGLRANGEVTFTATTLEGSVVSTASVAGQDVEFRVGISGHRTGACTAQAPVVGNPPVNPVR
jgi:Protein of unknown function (DUF3617)